MKGLIFDCDGVLADTELDGHLVAFNKTFREVGLPVVWTPEIYGELLRIGGGKERMATLLTDDFCRTNGLPTDPAGRQAVLKDWHGIKTRHYLDLIATGAIPPRPGVARIAAEAHAAGWKLAVASTSAEPSVRAVLEQAVEARLAHHFEVFAGDVVPAKKPAPDIYLLALDRLELTPDQALVVEDSGIGLTAALAAGIRTVVTVSSFTGDDDFTGAALVTSSLGDDGVPSRVLANTTDLRFDDRIRLDDLDRLTETSEE